MGRNVSGHCAAVYSILLLHYAVVFSVGDASAYAIVIVVDKHAFVRQIAELGFVLFRKSFLPQYKHAPYLLPDYEPVDKFTVVAELLVFLREQQRFAYLHKLLHAALDVAEQHAGVLYQY